MVDAKEQTVLILDALPVLSLRDTIFHPEMAAPVLVFVIKRNFLSSAEATQGSLPAPTRAVRVDAPRQGQLQRNRLMGRFT